MCVCVCVGGLEGYTELLPQPVRVCVFLSPSVIFFFFLCWKRSFVSAVCRQRTRGLQQQSHTSVTAFDRRGGCRYLRGRHLSLAGRNHRPIKTPFSRPCIYNIIIRTHYNSHNSHMYIIEYNIRKAGIA